MCLRDAGLLWPFLRLLIPCYLMEILPEGGGGIFTDADMKLL